MKMIRRLLLLSILCATVGGCTVIRGSAAGPSGSAWYVRAGYFTSTIKDIHYCPAQETTCHEATMVSNEEFSKRTVALTTEGEK